MLTTFRRYYGIVLGISGVVALLLAIIGFRTCFPTLSPDTLLYRSVQLFYWGYSPWDISKELPLPWTLSIARWLAPLVLLSALFGVALHFFRRQWEGWRARRMRDHTIICGGGEKGYVLASSLKLKGMSTVLVERHKDRVDMLSNEGFLTVPGDATETSTLLRAGITRAKRLVALTGDDHDNLAITVAAAQAVGPGSGLSLFLHSGDASLCDLYQRNRALTASLRGVPVRVFNHYRNVARRTIQDFQFDPGNGQAHLIMPGLSRVGLALIVEYALVGHYPGDRRTHIHLVGRRAIHDLEKLRVKYPSIDQCAILSSVEVHEADRFSTRVAEVVHEQPADSTFVICTGIEDDNEAFGHALELNEMLSEHASVRFLLDTPPGAAVRRLVEGSAELSRRISFLPTGEPASGYEAVIGESLDRTARKIHENWMTETRKQIAAARTKGDESAAKKHEAKSTFREWDELSEEQKGANRSQADHIAFKVRAVGLDPKTATQSDWSKLSTDQIESLARLEHARWAAYYWMTGWTYAAQRNDQKKQHPNLVPYDDLDEPTKDYDRAAVRLLGEYLSV
jgi:hypothetical protein